MTFRELAFGAGGGSKSNIPEQNILRSFGRRERSLNGDISYYRRTRSGTHIGEESLASGDGAVAVGAFAFAQENETTSIGMYSRAEGRRTTVIGNQSTASGPQSIAIGFRTNGAHHNTILIGNNLSSSADDQIKIGDRMLVDAAGDLFIDGVNISAVLVDLPFQGVLGNGQHGAKLITTNETATEDVPVYQYTTFEITAGDTLTANASLNPGGFLIAVQGRCTIAGTIDADGRGASAGAQLTAGAGASSGKNGGYGFNFSGSGGSGGDNGTQHGGHGGPCSVGSLLGFYDGSQSVATALGDNWYGDSTDTTVTAVDLHREASTRIHALIGGNGSPGSTKAGTAYGGIGTGTGTNLFALAWSLHRQQLIGFGAGGGSGCQSAGGADRGGSGGNGGGAILILCDELDFSGTINARGTAGGNAAGANAGGGGGGGGGSVIIGYRTLIANTGTINVGGGAAGTGLGTGNAGGAGGAGFSKVFDMRV